MIVDIRLERIEGEITDDEYEEIMVQIIALTQTLGINGLIYICREELKI